jgi:hypothetical protein
MPISHIKRTPVGSPRSQNYSEVAHEPLTPLPQNAFASKKSDMIASKDAPPSTSANTSPRPSVNTSSFTSPVDPACDHVKDESSHSHYTERMSVDYYGGTISNYLTQSPASPHPPPEHHRQRYSSDQIRRSSFTGSDGCRQDSVSLDPLSTRISPGLEESGRYV